MNAEEARALTIAVYEALTTADATWAQYRDVGYWDWLTSAVMEVVLAEPAAGAPK